MPGPSVQLLITLDNGQVHVQGPIQDKILCYGLLEMAHDAIKDHHDAQAKSGIVPARTLQLPPVNGH